jgi:hypothetical protein
MLQSAIWDSDIPRWASDETVFYMWDRAVVAAGFRLGGLAKRLADEIANRGPWAFGLQIDGLAGLQSAPSPHRFRSDRQVLTAYLSPRSQRNPHGSR